MLGPVVQVVGVVVGVLVVALGALLAATLTLPAPSPDARAGRRDTVAVGAALVVAGLALALLCSS